MAATDTSTDDSDRAPRGRTLGWTSSIYFGEGLPWSVLHQVASEYLTAIGMPAREVGYTGWLNGTTLLKFLWSPLVDLFGTLKRWMVATQALLGIGVGVLAVVAHRLAGVPGDKDTRWVWLTLLGLGVLSATYDIACDGYYMGALKKHDQARYSGARVAAYRAAMLVGSSGLVFLGGRFNWLVAFGLAAALLFALALVHQRILKEVPRSGPEPEPTGTEVAAANVGWQQRLAHVKDAYLSFLLQPKALLVLGFLLSYKMSDNLVSSMSKLLFARELGVPTDVRGVLNSLSLVASIIGAIVGGAWIAKRSLKTTLFRITLLMAATQPLFVALAAFAPELLVSIPGTARDSSELVWSNAWPGLCAVASVIVLEQVSGGMAVAAQIVFIMQHSAPEHRAAHYAFATAVYSLPQTVIGGLSGQLYEGVGPVTYFCIVSLLTLPAVVLARVVPTERLTAAPGSS